MKPILFHILDYGVPSYAALMALGYVVALLFLWLNIRRLDAKGGSGVEFSQAFDLYIVMVVASLLGSKFAHVLFEAAGHVDEHGHTIDGLFELLKSDPWHWARLGEGGYVWYGGLLGSLGSAWVYFRNRPYLNGWLYSDTFTPSIVAGSAVGRLGCFLAGCCYGKPTTGPMGVQFPALPGPVHPTQLYESTLWCLILVVLWVNFPRRRFDGENIGLLLLLYSIGRAVIEVFRGDTDRGIYGPISTSQIISIPLFVLGLVILGRGRPRPSVSMSA